MARVLCLAACMALLPGAAQAQGASGNEQHNQLGGEPGAGADATACAPRIISVQAARAPVRSPPCCNAHPRLFQGRDFAGEARTVARQSAVSLA